MPVTEDYNLSHLYTVLLGSVVGDMTRLLTTMKSDAKVLRHKDVLHSQTNLLNFNVSLSQDRNLKPI